MESSNLVFRTTRSTYLAVAFVAATMIANIMSLRMVAPLGIVMDAGTLLYPVTFLIRDMIHRESNLSAANRTVTISVVCNIAMFALFAFTAWLPYDAATGEQVAFGLVLMPGILIVAGSVVAQFFSERLDGHIFQAVYRDDPKRYVRAILTSNLISIPIDSIIMCGIAFGFTIPIESVIVTMLANIGIKYFVMFASVFVYATAGASKRA